MATVATRPASRPTTANPVTSRFLTAADLLHHLGDVPAGRVRLSRFPARPPSTMSSPCTIAKTGSASWLTACSWRKSWGLTNQFVRYCWRHRLVEYLKAHDLGKVVGADGMMRLFPGRVRIPDVAFISWERYPKGKRRRGEIPTVAPDLVVEILSKGNTPKEMKRKLDEYFQAGVRPGLVRQSRGADGPRLHKPHAIGPFERDPRAQRGRGAAGLHAVDKGLVRRGPAERGEIVIGGQTHRTAIRPVPG